MSAPTNEQLAKLILPWAKERHPEKYQQTLRVAAIHDTFRRYMLRLVEIRVEEEPGWINEVSVLVLEETKLVQRLKDRQTGDVYEVKGKLADGPRITTFAELALPREDFLSLQRAKQALDLEYVDD